ncbi:MAG: hypothetical protein ACREFF_05075, partial [Candidatus Udaeobacter sp.]
MLGSTGCWPVVAGSPAGNISFTGDEVEARCPGLGKLPRPTGWQPVLPRIMPPSRFPSLRCICRSALCC